ncbi:MAG TPA: heme-binding protein [Caulobacteraceae bacterium]|jgi:uncharacterized protein GlcG (DUF336 family)|nr:heme-binding protein [Caulobacteraceae bacterium]
MVKLAEASGIIDAGLKHARANKMPPMTMAVLDAGGNLVAFQKEDNSSLLRESISRGKAWGALGMGVGSRNFVARAENHRAFFDALMAMSDGKIVPVPGGVLIRNAAGEIIGAVGVSGFMPDQDEACAVVGIQSVGLVADPGA